MPTYNDQWSLAIISKRSAWLQRTWFVQVEYRLVKKMKQKLMSNPPTTVCPDDVTIVCSRLAAPKSPGNVVLVTVGGLG